MSRWYNEFAKKKRRTDDEMSDYEIALTACLSEAGFDGDTVNEAIRLYKNGSRDDLKQYLRSKRCDLIEQMHESQKRIDRFDYVIRKTDKI